MSAEPSHNTIAAELAKFITSLKYDDLPPNVVESAKKLVLDQLACQLAGSSVPWVQPVIKLVQLTACPDGECTVVNHGIRVMAADAALANATFGQACELDDIAYGSGGHVGAATLPVALALGERDRIDGRRLIVAIAAGYEVMYRLVLSVRPYQNKRGFHAQGIAGPFAAAATAGKLLALNDQEMTHALAIAGSHACGPLEYDQSGGEVKRLHAGLAARGGLHSALLAKFGLTGPPTIIEGKRGFCNIFATQSDPSRITPGLGKTFNLPNTYFKVYPVVGPLQTAVAAIERLVREYAFSAADVQGVRVGLSDSAVVHTATIRQPGDVLGAQFSLAFSIALAVCKKSNELAHYMNSALWSDPEIMALADRVEAYAHPAVAGIKDHMAVVTVELKGGRTLEATEEHPKGTPHNPISKDELNAKVRSLSAPIIGCDRVDAMIRMVEELESVKDVSSLAKLLVREKHA